MDRNEILCECQLDNLIQVIADFENQFHIEIITEPGLCMAMVRANDNLEKQEFYLGEVLTSECEVKIDDKIGYGIVVGDEPKRVYCIAVIKAVEKLNNEVAKKQIEEFMLTEHNSIRQEQKNRLSKIMKSKVDFKLMD